MTTPLDRLKKLNKLRSDRISKAAAISKKITDQATAAAKVGQEIRNAKG